MSYAVSDPVLVRWSVFSPVTGSALADRPPREDLPLPTNPPYTAFIGNLAFDVTETEMATFFGGHEVRHKSLSKLSTRCSHSCFPDEVDQNH